MLENFRRGRPSSYQVQVGAPGFNINDGVANWDYQNLGLFLQDTWTVNEHLTLTAGVRVDRIGCRRIVRCRVVLRGCRRGDITDAGIDGSPSGFVARLPKRIEPE